MNQANNPTSNNQLSKNTISYLNSNLTPKGRSLLAILYKYPALRHKDLAQALDMSSSSLTNLMTRINNTYQDFIKSESVGCHKFYSLSQIAETYTEIILLPEKNARDNARVSFLHNDLLTNNVWNSLRKFQEYEGDNWYLVLDDLLFVETRKQLTRTTDSNDVFEHIYSNLKNETYQNYTNFINSLISLVIQQGKTSVQKIYGILDHIILAKRLDLLLTNILNDFYKMESLFHLEKNDLKAAYSLIDKIFSEHFPEIFGENSLSSPTLLPAEYYSIYSVIINMTKEFKNNNYNKATSIEQWEKKFHTGKHFSCLSYIAEKCSTIYIKHS